MTVNLSPASLPKQGSGFDLAIALAVLAGSGIVPSETVAQCVHLGELALDGRVRPVAGVLPAVVAARESGAGTVMVPWGNRTEAELVPGIRVLAVSSLRHAAAVHGADIDTPETDPLLPAHSSAPVLDDRDLADVVGQPEVVEALIVAAAGRHHTFMLGSPGAGKTMLAERLVSVLPDLTQQDALEVTSIASLANLQAVDALMTRPPFEAPHHTATAVSIIGGGSGLIRPGAVSRASRGILFLDEAPEFSPTVLDALRQPLESGVITIHRARQVAHFPASVQLVLAANPCPCGNAGDPTAECTCTPDRRRRYLGRLSGPILDRVDIHIPVRRVARARLLDASEPRVTTAEARVRIVEAQNAARERWGAEMPAAHELRAGRFRLDPRVMSPLDSALDRGALSMRGYDRTIRIAWTVADLDGSSSPTRDHIGRALYLRQGVAA